MTASPLKDWQSCNIQKLLNKIAQAFPDLFGYVGIDLILSDDCYVVEINPRLTSSYSGIKQALGINIAELVLQSMNGEAVINPLHNRTILIEIAQEQSNDV
jgi:predicted ATP-grasp superfamily ATP-dependent carboligase